MIVMIDHDDSFTYNLVHYLEDSQEQVKVIPHDEAYFQLIKELNPKVVVLSPGSGHPEDQHNSIDVVSHLKGKIPILGVCLGFQIIVLVFGGKVVEAIRPMHGRIDFVSHDGQSIYQHLKNPLQVTRYHSLVADHQTFPNELIITSQTTKGEVMSCRHREYPIEGVQYHPEAILTTEGKQLLNNFLNIYQPVRSEN